MIGRSLVIGVHEHVDIDEDQESAPSIRSSSPAVSSRSTPARSVAPGNVGRSARGGRRPTRRATARRAIDSRSASSTTALSVRPEATACALASASNRSAILIVVLMHQSMRTAHLDVNDRVKRCCGPAVVLQRSCSGPAAVLQRSAVIRYVAVARRTRGACPWEWRSVRSDPVRSRGQADTWRLPMGVAFRTQTAFGSTVLIADGGDPCTGRRRWTTATTTRRSRRTGTCANATRHGTCANMPEGARTCPKEPPEGAARRSRANPCAAPTRPAPPGRLARRPASPPGAQRPAPSARRCWPPTRAEARRAPPAR